MNDERNLNMKAAKAFGITLLVVLAIGVIFILGTGKLGKNTEETASATEASTTHKKSANPVTKAVVSEVIDTYVEQSDGQVKEIYEQMSEDDKDAVTEIIASNVTIDSVSEVQSYISSGDKDGLMEYAKDNLSEEEIEELADIMSKYVEP